MGRTAKVLVASVGLVALTVMGWSSGHLLIVLLAAVTAFAAWQAWNLRSLQL